MNKIIKTVLAFFLVGSICTGCSSLPKNAPDNFCGKPTAWDNFNVFDLKVTLPKKPGYGLWKGQYDKESQDIQIDVNTSDGGSPVTGKIILVGGRVMATKGLVTIRGYEIDSLDGPVLYQSLVYQLFGQILPKGPGEIHKTQKIDFWNKETGIEYRTQSASGSIIAPWHVTGDVVVVAPDVIEYQLSLVAPTGNKEAGQDKEYVTNFLGRLSKSKNAKIADDFQLAGWSVFDVGQQTQRQGSMIIYDYGASPSTTIYKQVVDIRKKIAKNN